jgi:hypothetical protein
VFHPDAVTLENLLRDPIESEEEIADDILPALKSEESFLIH